MEPVMKVVDTKGKTHYLFNLSEVKFIRDGADGSAVIGINDNYYYDVHVKGANARTIKRSIQENLDEQLGFLKWELPNGKGRRYDNVRTIQSVRPYIHAVRRDGKLVEEEHTSLLPTGIGIAAPAQAVAAQIRRVLKRLEQDEEFCCSEETPAEEEESE